jgi:hypothetical protein
MWETFSERYDRAGAREILRSLLMTDGRATGDTRYDDALRALDRGYSSYRVDRFCYVAFACACPQTLKEASEKGQPENACTELPEGFSVRGTESTGMRRGGQRLGVRRGT